MEHRRRFKQTTSLEDRIAEEARRLREEAELLPHGPVREAAMRRVRQTETGSKPVAEIARLAATGVNIATSDDDDYLGCMSDADIARFRAGERAPSSS